VGVSYERGTPVALARGRDELPRRWRLGLSLSPFLALSLFITIHYYSDTGLLLITIRIYAGALHRDAAGQGARPPLTNSFHQKSTCLTQLTLGPNVLQNWSRNTLNVVAGALNRDAEGQGAGPARVRPREPSRPPGNLRILVYLVIYDSG